MASINIYTDEDVTKAVARALRRRGYEASTNPEHDNCGIPDEDQLRYATSIGAVLLTHNVQDFPRIHYDFMSRGISHAGVIVAKKIPIGGIVRGILRLALKLSAEDMIDRLEYLSGWR